MRVAARILNRLIPYRWIASICLILLLDVCNYFAFKPMSMRQVVDFQDKYLHTLGFFGLTCTGHVALYFDYFPRIRRFHVGIYSFNAAIWLGYGLFIEGMQDLLTYRDGTVADFVADALGVLIGLLFVATLQLYPEGARSPHGTR